MLVQFLNSVVSSILIYGLYVLAATIIIGIFAYKIILWQRFKFWKDKNIEQVPPIFPSGNFHDVLLQKKSIGEFLADLYKYSKAEITGFYIFHTPHILVRSPDIIKQVLVSDFGYFHDRTIASDERADSLGSKLLLNVKNPEWKVMRQKVTPIFTTSKIRGMSEHVVKSSKDLIKYLDENHHKGALESKELCAKFTTDVITSCAFGVEANCFNDEDAPFREAGRQLIDTTFMNGVRFMCYFLLPVVVRIFRVPFFHRGTMQFLKDAFLQTIGHREAVAGGPRGDLIDIIIELKKNKELGGGIKFEGDRVVAQAIQFFAAGFETTSATISFALYELALHPEMQDEARQCVQDLVNKGEKLNYDTMLQLTYLDRIVLETLRKYPSLPFLDRRCNKDFTIDSGETIPKGTPIFIPSIGLHYDKEHFPDPHRFDPDRFLPENAKNRHPFVFLPFGNGPHNCIGERFAMNAVKICLSHLLLKYKVEPCVDTPIPIEFSPKSFALVATKGVPLRFVKLVN